METKSPLNKNFWNSKSFSIDPTFSWWIFLPSYQATTWKLYFFDDFFVWKSSLCWLPEVTVVTLGKKLIKVKLNPYFCSVFRCYEIGSVESCLCKRRQRQRNGTRFATFVVSVSLILIYIITDGMCSLCVSMHFFLLLIVVAVKLLQYRFFFFLLSVERATRTRYVTIFYSRF